MLRLNVYKPKQGWRDLPDPVERDAARDSYMNRAIDELPKDVTFLFDENHKLRKENNLQAKALILQQAELDKHGRSLITNWIATIVQLLALSAGLIKLFSK